MSGELLPSLAILKSNWDQGGRSYVDFFVPFIADCMRASGANRMTAGEIAAAVRQRFGISMPEGVINTALKRAARDGLGVRQQRAFVINKEAVGRTNLDADRANAMRQVNALVVRLRRFALDTHGFSFSSDEEADAALRTYVDQHSIPMLRMIVTGATGQQQLPLSQDVDYILNSFVLDLFERDPEGFTCLETLVKGSMLTGVLYVPAAGDIGRKFERNTTLYLDTPVILAAVGYEGSARSGAASEFLELAYADGAGLACFEHTVAEIRGILTAVGTQINRRNRRVERIGGVESHFLSLGYNSSDIELLAGQLDKDIARRRIEIRPTPAHVPSLTVDERELEQVLQQKVHYAHRETLLNDLDSLTSVYRLRGGREQTHLESCRALFVTTNPGVVQAARAYFPVREHHSWPVAMEDHDVATLLWLKRPTSAPDLPRKQIVADCYAALEPGASVWSRYLDEINHLEEQGVVEEDQFFFLRYSFEAKRALMDMTRGDPAGVTAEVVREVIDRVRTELSAPAAEELLAERHRREAAESLSEAARMEVASTTDRLRQTEQALVAARREVDVAKKVAIDRVRRNVRWMKRCIASVFGVACLVGFWLGLPSTVGVSPSTIGPAWRWLARIAVALAVLVAIYGAWFGGSVKSAARSTEVWLGRWLEQRALRRLGLTSDNGVAGA